MLKIFAKGFNFLMFRSLKKNNVFIGNSLEYLHRKRELDKNHFDYVRVASLELISYEINLRQIKGNVAELGVYKGKFARQINRYFPDRVLYLFDTFEGFDQADVAKEKSQDLSQGDQDFSNTSVEAVLKVMPHPSQCKPIKGYFPESAKGVDDQFVFVSLDADLYDPLYAGLVFFYPKLVPGGYIFVHDFNNDHYKGARKAVETFCREQGINYMPLPDSCGSAVVMK
jgi:O-methyltransferase